MRGYVVAGALTVVAIVACSSFETDNTTAADGGTAEGGGAGDAGDAGDAGLLEQGLVAAWLFDEGTGRIAHDRVGNNDGTFVYDAGWTSGHDGGSALLLHGPDDAGNGDYVRVPGSASLTASLGNKPLTIAFWMNHAAGLGTVPRVFAWKNSVHLKLNNDRLELELDGQGAAFWAQASKVAGRWHHLAATYEGGNVAIYEDGVKDVIADDSGTPPTTLPIGGDILIGVSSDEDSFATGAIERVYLWNRALSADEIKQVMTW